MASVMKKLIITAFVAVFLFAGTVLAQVNYTPTITPTPTGPTPTITATQTVPPTITPTDTPAPRSNLKFYTVLPCRLVDTRDPASPGGLIAGTTKTYFFHDKCGLPPTAVAAALNVVVVQPTAGPGFLTVWPGGLEPGVSTINYNKGNIRANGAIVYFGNALLSIDVACHQAGGTAQLIVDVNGYFAP